MMANMLVARVALPSGPAWGVVADDRIEIVASDAGTNGGFLASLLQLPRPARVLAERRRGAPENGRRLRLAVQRGRAAPAAAARPARSLGRRRHVRAQPRGPHGRDGG